MKALLTSAAILSLVSLSSVQVRLFTLYLHTSKCLFLIVYTYLLYRLWAASPKRDWWKSRQEPTESTVTASTPWSPPDTGQRTLTRSSRQTTPWLMVRELNLSTELRSILKMQDPFSSESWVACSSTKTPSELASTLNLTWLTSLSTWALITKSFWAPPWTHGITSLFSTWSTSTET